MRISSSGYSPYANRTNGNQRCAQPTRCAPCQPQRPQQPAQPTRPNAPSAPPQDPRGGPVQQFVDRSLRTVYQQVAGGFPQGDSAVGQLTGDKNSSTLTGLLGSTGLVPAAQDLEKKGPVTVLAPTNQAFERLSQESPELFQKLTNPANKEALQKILLYHVSGEQFGLESGQQFNSVNDRDGARFFGNPFYGRIQNGDQTINTGTARLAANGSLVIPVDQVLIPPDFDPTTLK